MRNKLIQGLSVLALGMAGLIGNSQAGYSSVVFFGDSLSDAGNVLSLTTPGGQPFPSFPGAEGRFSNGPVWSETLARGLGFADAAKPSNLFLLPGALPTVVPIGPSGGQNYAYGGALTGLDGLAGPNTGLVGQLAAWNGALFGLELMRAADPEALYVLMIGGNDLRGIRDLLAGAGDADARKVAAAGVAANVIAAVDLLARAGGNHFLLSSVPDLGKTPEAAALNAVQASTEVTLAFNSALAIAAGILEAEYLATKNDDLDIRMLDFYGLSEAVFADAVNNGGGIYGISSVNPCITAGQFSGAYFAPDAIGAGCDAAAFADPLHPSSAVHSLLGRLALSTVPEPGSQALVLAALLALAAARRRRAASKH